MNKKKKVLLINTMTYSLASALLFAALFAYLSLNENWHLNVLFGAVCGLVGAPVGVVAGLAIGLSWRWLELRTGGRPKVPAAVLLLAGLLLVGGCSREEEAPPTPIPPAPTAAEVTAPEGVMMALEASLAELMATEAFDMPEPAELWTAENVTPQGAIGTTYYRLTSGSCVVTISYPVTAPESTIYHVRLDDQAAGLQWEGDVDAQGQVLDQPVYLEEATGAELGTVNIVELADLERTVLVEICTLEWACYTPLASIDEPELIASLVAALDQDLKLGPRARCPSLYQLTFTLDDGQQHTFGYSCELKTPVFLRGGQEFWGGHDAVAPDAFNELLLPLLTERSLQ